MLVFFDNVHLTFCRIGLKTPLRRWDIVIFWCAVQCWGGWDLVSFWVYGTMLERVRSCDLLVRGTILNRVKSCDLLGVWVHVEEDEVLWSSGYVGNMLGRVRSSDLLGVWVHLGGVWHCDLLGIWHHIEEREEKLRLDRTPVLYWPLANLTDNK